MEQTAGARETPSVEPLAAGTGPGFHLPALLPSPLPQQALIQTELGRTSIWGDGTTLPPRPGEIPVSWDDFRPSCALEAQAADSIAPWPRPETYRKQLPWTYPLEINKVQRTKHRPRHSEAQAPPFAINLLCDLRQVTSPA